MREVEQLVHLRSCACLNALTLEANPITKHPVYRRVVHHYLPTLLSLDDEPFEAQDREAVRATSCVAVGDEWMIC